MKNDIRKYINKELKISKSRKFAIPLIPLIIVLFIIIAIIFVLSNNSGKTNTRVLIESSSYNDASSEKWKNGIVICENGYIYNMKDNYFTDSSNLEENSTNILQNATFKVRKNV